MAEESQKEKDDSFYTHGKVKKFDATLLAIRLAGRKVVAERALLYLKKLTQNDTTLVSRVLRKAVQTLDGKKSTLLADRVANCLSSASSDSMIGLW